MHTCIFYQKKIKRKFNVSKIKGSTSFQTKRRSYIIIWKQSKALTDIPLILNVLNSFVCASQCV